MSCSSLLRALFFGFFLLISTLGSAQSLFKVRDYGASPKGDVLATEAIQKAIDAAAAAGGGTVLFTPGSYLSSTVFLKSNIRLHLEAGATLLASRNKADYTFSKGIYSTETDVPMLLYAENQSNITIDGPGVIDGQAEQTYEDLRENDNFITEIIDNARKSGIEMKRYYAVDPKVCLIYWVGCKNIQLNNFQMLRSPNWTLHLASCEQVNIQGLYIYSSLEKGVNADGIDIDGCREVRISNCTVITGDDAICLKSTNKNGKYTACDNITITNCTLQSTSTALKIGTESHGDFHNIVFSNSAITNTNRGIGIFVRDGAKVSQVIFSNLTIECKRKHFNWWGDGDPIRFVLLKRKPDSRLGSISDVLIENVVATGQGTSLIEGYVNPIGEVERRLENITLVNVSLKMQAEDLVDKRASQALRVNGVNNLTVDNAAIRWDFTKSEPKWGAGIGVSNCSLPIIRDSRLASGDPKSAALILTNTVDGLVQNTVLSGAGSALVSTVGLNKGLEVVGCRAGGVKVRK